MKDRVSKHILNSECECHCGCGQMFKNQALFDMFEKFREWIGIQMMVEIALNIHCINRCKEHNAKIGGELKSKHLLGAAMDFSCGMMDIKKLHGFALSQHIKDNILYGGLGLYDWGCHIDVCGFRLWDNRSKS